MEKYESGVKRIESPVHDVYRVLSDMRNIQMLVDAMNNPMVQQQFANSIPEDKKAEYENAKNKMGELVKDLTFTYDTISCNTALGSIGVKVADREPQKVVKLSSEKSPVNFDFWVQVKELEANATAIKLTLKADIPFMVRMMFSSKLDQLNEGIDKAASILTRLPYGLICQRMDSEGRTENEQLDKA